MHTHNPNSEDRKDRKITRACWLAVQTRKPKVQGQEVVPQKQQARSDGGGHFMLSFGPMGACTYQLLTLFKSQNK